MLGLTWLFNFIADEFLVVALPRTLILHNRRLGLIHKALQTVVVILAVLYSVYSGIFFQHNIVREWGVNVWHVANPMQAAATGSRVGPECEKPETYAYEGDAMFSYAPTSCKVLPNDLPNRIHGDELFLPTFVDEETAWEKCGANVSELCKGYNSGAACTKANGRCACTLNEQFLVQNADERHIRFVYGYEVDASDGKRSDLRNGGIVSSLASKGALHQMKEHESNLVTQFLSPDGSECRFGGRSLWQHSDAVGGITGTLNELLACAGVTLDSDPATLVAGTVVAPQHLRTMGFKLQMHLLIVEDALFRLKCEVRVAATPVATALWDNNAGPSVSPEIGASERRTRRVHGVAISVHMTGSIKTFSWSQVVRGCVDITVVLALPKIIVQFVAMYMLGLVSEVYRHAARTKLDIFAKFHNTMAKLMLAEVAFRGLVGKWDGRTRDLGSVSPPMLLQRVEDIFEDRCDTGVLGKEELLDMASVVFSSMDKDGNGEIGCMEFIQACTEDGEISLHMLAHFFEAKPLPFMRWLLDNTHTVSRNVSTSSRDILSFRIPTPSRILTPRLATPRTPTPRPSTPADQAPTTCRPPTNHLLTAPSSVTTDIMGSFDDTAEIDDDSSASREEMKEKLPSVFSSQDILVAHGSILVRLERRIQELEAHCEEALDALWAIVEPPQMTLRQANRDSRCPMRSSSSGNSSERMEGICDLATCHSPAPHQPPTFPHQHPDFQEAMTVLLQDVDTCAAVGPVPLDDTPVDADPQAAVLIVHHSNRDAVVVDDLLMHFDLLDDDDIDKYDVDVADIDEETACVFIQGNLPVRMLEMCASKRMHRVRREYDNLSVPVLVVDGARYTPPDLPILAQEFREHRSLN